MSKATPPPPGIYVPAVVFFTENDELDIPSIKSHVLRLAKGGVTGILVQGSNGEAQHLSHEERILAIRTTRETLNENGFTSVLVIAGTGAQSTRETIQLCKEAHEAGASHALVLTPSTWLPQMTKENIILFHRTVADGSPIPTMIYNFPVVTAGIDLDSDTLTTLAAHPNIVGTKLSCGNVGKLTRLTSTFPASEFAVFPGTSDVFVPSLLVGGAGVIGASVNILPKVHAEVYRLWKEGKTDEALKLQYLLAHGDWAVKRIGGIAGLKAIIVKEFGYGSGRVRGPLVPVSAEKVDALQQTKLPELFALEKSL
ncbi:dihydrodipicolinate synthetase [Fomitiporia mediterranea MF3/22]|uniref:dihydrodipicolinate synthetase n=1 Tax=Fomitiporia mediterranea (strain MF3/22) TaxID=694068 RepID=UPI0004409723|nr:dihydrodipicolinate synthetase [Fomitiporia mediterranea MF3/22]EJD06816.1 dihydrodipicolinate synthetase [Fomitiporia mediterranea MF3/22]